MPLIKEPRWLLETTTRYLDDGLNNLSLSSITDKSTHQKMEKIFSYKLSSGEFVTLKCRRDSQICSSMSLVSTIISHEQRALAHAMHCAILPSSRVWRSHSNNVELAQCAPHVLFTAKTAVDKYGKLPLLQSTRC